METKVIDNWLDKDLVDHINYIFLFRVPHYFGHGSSEKEVRITLAFKTKII